jgi:hypothetical protein
LFFFLAFKMKFRIMTLALLQAVDACIVVHANLDTCRGPANLAMGNVYHVDAEMYDNGEMVCTGGRDKRTSSGDWYPIPCNEGYSLEIAPSGVAVS